MDENKERNAASLLIRAIVDLLDYNDNLEGDALEEAIKLVLEYKANG